MILFYIAILALALWKANFSLSNKRIKEPFNGALS